MFLKLFTEQNKKALEDNISKMVNNEAEQMIREIFK